MFGHNEIAGAKHFAGEPTDTLLVTSVFYTLQGEGPFAGRPAVFVRLAKCQLACSFCDTFFDHGDRLTFEQIGRAAREAIWAWAAANEVAVESSPILVITGGEPMLQPNLTRFLNSPSIQPFNTVQIESNGLILRDLPHNTHLVVSPKCAEKNGKPTHYLKPQYDTLMRANTLKFVMSGDPGSPYFTVPYWALQWMDITGGPVYVSPMNEYTHYPDQSLERAGGDLKARTKGERVSFWEPGLLDLEKVRRNHEHAAAYCLRTGAFLTMQMQLFAGLP